MTVTATGIFDEGGDVPGAPATSVTTAGSVSVVAGRVYLFVIHGAYNVTAATPSSVTGPGGLVATLVATTGNIQTYSRGSVWHALAPSTATGAISVNLVNACDGYWVQALELGGDVDVGGANGANAVRQSTAGTPGSNPCSAALGLAMLPGNRGLVASFTYRTNVVPETATADWSNEVYDSGLTFAVTYSICCFSALSTDHTDQTATVTWSVGDGGGSAYAAIALELHAVQVFTTMATSQLRLVEWSAPPQLVTTQAALAAPTAGAVVEGFQEVLPDLPLKWLRWDNGSPVQFDVGQFEGRGGSYQFGQGASAPNVINGPAATATGTAAAAVWNPANQGEKLWRVRYPTTATAGNIAGVRAAANFLAGAVGYVFRSAFVINEPAPVAGARAFVGLTNNIAAPTNVEPSTIVNAIGVARLSTNNTQLYLIASGSSAQAAVALGTGFPPFSAAANGNNGVPYEFWVYTSTSGTTYWLLRRLDTLAYISGQLTGTIGTQRPAQATTLSPRAWCCNNATALATWIEPSCISWLRLAM